MDVLDRALLLDNVGGDPDLLREIVDLFFESSGELLSSIRDAVQRVDHEAVFEHTHQLKGSLASLGARAAADAALRLERMGRTGGGAGIQDALGALESEIGRLAPELRSLVAGAH